MQFYGWGEALRDRQWNGREPDYRDIGKAIKGVDVEAELREQCISGSEKYAEALISAGYNVPCYVAKVVQPPKPQRQHLGSPAVELRNIPTKYRSIIAESARKHQIRCGQLLGRGRERIVAHARQEAIWHIKNAFPILSLCEIGRIFKLNHSTIIHALEAHENRMRRIAA